VEVGTVAFTGNAVTIEREVASLVALDDLDEFTAFVGTIEPPLRRALVGYYGLDVGREAAAEALAYAWEHRRTVLTLEHPVAYLFRVGQSRSRSIRRHFGTGHLPVLAEAADAMVEPGLHVALMKLSDRQRAVVVLCAAFEWTLDEVGTVLGVSRSTVQRHLERALRHLRVSLGVPAEP
jgi:DNA-directed RNA polymerase specialized sigma24 family protein